MGAIRHYNPRLDFLRRGLPLALIAFVSVTAAVYDYGEVLSAGEGERIIVPGGESGPDSPRPHRGIPLAGGDLPGHGAVGGDLDASRHGEPPDSLFGGSDEADALVE